MLYKQPYNLIRIVFEIFVPRVKRMKIQKTFQSHFKLFCAMGQLLYGTGIPSIMCTLLVNR
jgi:hypothetical protein